MLFNQPTLKDLKVDSTLVLLFLISMQLYDYQDDFQLFHFRMNKAGVSVFTTIGFITFFLLTQCNKKKGAHFYDGIAEKFGFPEARVVNKIQYNELSAWVSEFIKVSPYFVLGTSDDQGDSRVSPRGGEAGFVTILDKNHLFFPDMVGNKLFESLRNISTNSRISMLFMIPGINEMARVNGSAIICDQSLIKDLDKQFKVELAQKYERGIFVTVIQSYYQCALAMQRSKLWNTTIIESHMQERPISQRPNQIDRPKREVVA